MTKAIWLTILLISISVSQLSNAQQLGIYPTFPNEINPQYFYFEGKPGEKITEYLSITNFSDSEIQLKITAVDSAPDSFFKTNNQLQEEFGRWTKIINPKPTLQPNEYIEIPFITILPANAEKRKYSGGIAIQENTSQEFSTRRVVPVYFEITDSPFINEKFIYSEIPARLYPPKNFIQKIYFNIQRIYFIIKNND